MRVGVAPPPVSDAAWRAACQRLRDGWSPEQIAVVADPELAISAATTRRRIDQDRADGGKLFRLLRHRGKTRRSPAWRAAQKCKSIPGRVHFSQRPPGADDRGSRHTSGLLLLSERKNRETRIGAVRNINAVACATAAIRLLKGCVVRSHHGRQRGGIRATRADHGGDRGTGVFHRSGSSAAAGDVRKRGGVGSGDDAGDAVGDAVAAAGGGVGAAVERPPDEDPRLEVAAGSREWNMMRVLR